MATITDEEAKRKALEAGTYDVPDLAKLLKCSERHIRNMVEVGNIPGVIRFGRLVRFHRGIVNDWLSERAKGTSRE
jgi:excisionase family DNA binding protein